MLMPYGVGVAAMVVLTAVWLGVQLAWRRTFPAEAADPDLLAGRMGCGGCERAERCERPGPRDNEPEEETR